MALLVCPLGAIGTRGNWENEASIVAATAAVGCLLADHNSVMVPGVDTECVPTELPAVVKPRRVQGTVVTELELEDAWVHLHGDNGQFELCGYTFPLLHYRIDQLHMRVAMLHTILSLHTVTPPPPPEF